MFKDIVSKAISWRESGRGGRLRQLLPLRWALPAAIVFSAMVFPAMLSGQTSPFDELNGRLHETADRLLTDTASMPTPRETVIRAVPSQGAAQTPERRTQPGSRVQQLRPVIDPILRGEGIPAEFAAVALVESGGQPAALSPKGARGVWQLMPETARRYGLVVSTNRDDRLDLVSATRAAARYLRDLYAQFADWELALAAYNAGEQAVQSAIHRAGSNRFSVLSQLRLLPAETRNYVPAVMNARRLIAQTTIAAGESISVPSLPTRVKSAPVQNLPRGKVFYAMNAAEPQVDLGGADVQQTSSITE
jgi:transglycosylase-like protein with SLT domain